MTPASTAVVIVTHDTREEVLGVLATLATHPGPVVVVDSGSTDGTAAAVRSGYPAVTVIELENVGYGRGINAGVALLPAEVDVIIAANADVRFASTAVATLVEELASDDAVAIVGPRVRYPDGSHQASARRTPSFATAVIHGLIGWLRPDNASTARYHALDLTGPEVTEACDVDWVSGCAFAVRRSDFERINGFDPGYRLFVEDVDLCERLRASGRRIRFQPAAEVVHRGGASTSHRPIRSRLLHARALDRYLSRRERGAVRHVRPLLWPALAGWVMVTSVAERLRGPRGRPTLEGDG